MSESNVFYFDGDDPEMLEAYEKARGTFRYFWRELTWEYRRIIPAFGLCAVKAAFSDEPANMKNKSNAKVEQMWVNDVFFDGKVITGRLLNTPNELQSLEAGDEVSRTLNEITDWIYTCDDVAFGGFTVNLMRSKMDKEEREAHDEAWGLEFGDPSKIRIVQDEKYLDGEHPMSENMSESLASEIKKNRDAFLTADDNGWSTLHSLCLGGSYGCVKVLLENGANPNEKSGNGLTPLQLAEMMQWDKVATLLRSHGAK
jgi:uncharacterized protein